MSFLQYKQSEIHIKGIEMTTSLFRASDYKYWQLNTKVIFSTCLNLLGDNLFAFHKTLCFLMNSLLLENRKKYSNYLSKTKNLLNAFLAMPYKYIRFKSHVCGKLQN